MKSVVCHGARDLRVEERNTPEVGADEVLVRVEAGGICGSDLHYYNHGGFGKIRIKEPMILGHEVAGRVAETGAAVEGLNVGDLVAINPSRPCGTCEYCRQAMYNQCLNMRFYGSAMPFPHIQGAFRQTLLVGSEQCYKLPDATLAGDAAFAEPLSVALHALNRAGPVIGRRVLVTGCGPIGTLVVAVAKLHGALEVVATDMVDEALEKAQTVGADVTVNVMTHPEDLQKYASGKGVFDIVIEASGAPAALLSALDVIRPRGRLVQLGLGSEVTLPANLLVAKEIELLGSFRFHEEFAWAVELIGAQRVPLSALLTGTYPVEEAVAAFEVASDRKQSMKVQLSFV